MLAAVLSVVCAALSVGIFVLWRKTEKNELEKQILRDRLAESELEEALAQQKVEAAELRLKDFEQLKIQFEQYAKSAALETGNQLSNKLLADHQRAREETHKQFEQFTKLATEQWSQRHKELAESLGKVQGQMDMSTGKIDILVRAMKNPIGAGAEGEIALDNLLQQLGLTPGQDYDLQVHLANEGGNLRPDGVVYLPNQQALVIDAKASQHIFALYEADGTPQFDAVFERVRATMKQHAKALAGKAYAEEVARLLKAKGKTGGRVMLLMFVPNDEVITRLRRKDPELTELMTRSNIILAGPSTLPAVFMYASTLIREARQQDEQHVILELVEALMGDLITAMSHAGKVIQGIGTSAKSFDAFAASMNSGVLSRLRKLYDKGLRPTKNRTLPGNLPRYEIKREDDLLTVEAEEVGLLSLPKEDAA